MEKARVDEDMLGKGKWYLEKGRVGEDMSGEEKGRRRGRRWGGGNGTMEKGGTGEDSWAEGRVHSRGEGGWIGVLAREKTYQEGKMVRSHTLLYIRFTCFGSSR